MNTRIIAGLLLALFLATLGFAQGASADATIRILARTLSRLGEKDVAKRLITDYQAGRVRFSDIGEAGVNAETGRERGGNRMDLDLNVRKLGEQEKLLAKRPYGASSLAVMYAATVLHEYQHMDLANPSNTPRFEDPAHRHMDRVLARWAANLEAEWKALAAQPPSAIRDRKAAEVRDLMQRVLSECGSFQEAVARNVAAGRMSPGQKWQAKDTANRLRAAIAKAQAGLPKTPVRGVLPVSKVGWELVEVVDYNADPGNPNYHLAYARGAIGWRWALGDDIFGFRSTWTEPPKRILPGDTVKITITVDVTENVGDYYSANGSFAIWFDRPDIEPGSVGAPIGLKTATGESGGVDVSHRVKTAQSFQRELSLPASALGSGKLGTRIALITAAFIGRMAGTKYVYEWRRLG